MTNREFNNKFSTFMMNTFLATLKYRTGRGADLDKIVTDGCFDGGSPELRREAEGIVGQMVAAFLNPVRLTWDLDHVRERLTPGADGLNEGKEADLASRFPPPELGGNTISRPTTVVDVHGRIAVWAMPNLFSPLRQMAVYQADAHIAPYFKSPSDSGSWRNNSRYFAPKCDSPLPNGCLNMSPAWYEMGKEKSPQATLVTSPVFKHPDSGIDNWIGELRDFHALCTGVLRIMHPHLYRASQQLFQKLAAEDVSPFTDQWGLPFTAVSIISNRWSPFHRDTKASPSMYDMLVTVGEAERTLLRLPDLGLVVRYGAGSVVGITGRLIRHGVEEETSPRVCHAYYFRKAVFDRHLVMEPGLMSQVLYTPYMENVSTFLGGQPTMYVI